MDILVVEDTERTRRRIVGDLRSHGHEVMEAEDGAEALKILKENNFDFIIADLNMPYLDGYGLSEKTGGHPPMFMYTSGESFYGIEELARRNNKVIMFMPDATPEKLL